MIISPAPQSTSLADSRKSLTRGHNKRFSTQGSICCNPEWIKQRGANIATPSEKEAKCTCQPQARIEESVCRNSSGEKKTKRMSQPGSEKKIPVATKYQQFLLMLFSNTFLITKMTRTNSFTLNRWALRSRWRVISGWKTRTAMSMRLSNVTKWTSSSCSMPSKTSYRLPIFLPVLSQ